MLTLITLKIGFWGSFAIGFGIGLPVGAVAFFLLLMWAADGINDDAHHNRRRYLP